jgi:hypothetical protein
MLVLALALAAGSAEARRHVYSYDPADPATTKATGPVTLDLADNILGVVTVFDLRSTVAEASADLRRAPPRDLSPGGIERLTGPHSGLGALYAIAPGEQGSQLIDALCPGSKRAWLAIGHVGFDEDLKIAVIGDHGPDAPTHLCQKLAYTFHGEWAIPPTGPKIDERGLVRRHFPGGP